MVDPLRDSAHLVARVVEFGAAGVNELARLGSDILLTALLARLGKTDQDDASDLFRDAEDPDCAAEEELSAAELITRGLLAGEGRYTRLEIAELAGIDADESRRLWRALGFPEADDDQRIFTSADVAATSRLKKSARSIAGCVTSPTRRSRRGGSPRCRGPWSGIPSS